jgi:hypothetical protein
VARVHGLVSGDRIEARYGQINAFERHLAENDVTILKPICTSLVSGMARKCALFADDRRQIVDFLLPGDFLALSLDTSTSSEIGAKGLRLCGGCE